MIPRTERILVRSVNWLGDAVMSTPALLRLREARPEAHIALLTPEKLAGLWHGHPALDEVLSFTRAEGIRGVRRRLRSGQFDRALIFPNSFRSALETWLAGIPARIGFAGGGRRWLLTRAVPPRPEHIRMHKRSSGEVQRLIVQNPERLRDRFPREAHHLHNYLHLVTTLGGNPDPTAPRLHVAAEEIEAFRARHSIAPGQRVLGLNPGAEYGPAKRWPRQYFIDAAVALSREIQAADRSSHPGAVPPGQADPRRPVLWMITGGTGDQAVAHEIELSIRQTDATAAVLNLASRTTLRELCVALATCQVVLTNDTGPMHLAAAVGARVVVPFGSTSPELTGPGLPGDSRHQLLLGRAPCAPCFRRTCPIDFRCMHSIRPEHAASAVLLLLNHPR